MLFIVSFSIVGGVWGPQKGPMEETGLEGGITPEWWFACSALRVRCEESSSQREVVAQLETNLQEGHFHY